MKQIPCIKNKCISYPICINKEEIECDDLAKYHKYLIVKHKYSYSECFQVIKKTIKRLRGYATTYPIPKGWRDAK